MEGRCYTISDFNLKGAKEGKSKSGSPTEDASHKRGNIPVPATTVLGDLTFLRDDTLEGSSGQAIMCK